MYTDKGLYTNRKGKGSMRSDRYTDEETDVVEQQAGQTQKKQFGRKAKADKSAANDDERDLSKLKKRELLEIMLAQGKEIDSLRKRVADLEEQLANREFEFSKIGSIAEASLAVTKVFVEAEEAAKIYLENIRRRYEQKK